jgi:CheY-like chemotaxis protein
MVNAEGRLHPSFLKMSPLRVLVADDESSIREIMGRILEGQGHYVQFAENTPSREEQF